MEKKKIFKKQIYLSETQNEILKKLMSEDLFEKETQYFVRLLTEEYKRRQ